ncbi:MAG: hypothetical protein IPK22_09470 [Verrucomicrobiaceae bacterium]|nr:hypothetical protein [Verrucomicrobiaceae bacterium]
MKDSPEPIPAGKRIAQVAVCLLFIWYLVCPCLSMLYVLVTHWEHVTVSRCTYTEAGLDAEGRPEGSLAALLPAHPGLEPTRLGLVEVDFERHLLYDRVIRESERLFLVRFRIIEPKALDKIKTELGSRYSHVGTARRTDVRYPDWWPTKGKHLTEVSLSADYPPSLSLLARFDTLPYCYMEKRTRLPVGGKE